MTHVTRALPLLLMFGLATTLSACGEPEETENNDNNSAWAGLTNPFAGDAAAAAEGKTSYDNENCAGCHGRDGKSASFLDLSTVTDAPEGRLYVSIRDGISGTAMTSYGGKLSEDDMWKIVTWVQTIE